MYDSAAGTDGTYFLTATGFSAPSRMPRTSSSRMMTKSSPSILISVPAYLPNRTRSPAFTSKGKVSPLSLVLPRPTEITSPSCGLSLALSGMMIPPRVVSASSTRRTTMRSCRGVSLVAILGTPFKQLIRFGLRYTIASEGADSALGPAYSSSCGVHPSRDESTGGQPRPAASTQVQRVLMYRKVVAGVKTDMSVIHSNFKIQILGWWFAPRPPY